AVGQPERRRRGGCLPASGRLLSRAGVLGTRGSGAAAGGIALDGRALRRAPRRRRTPARRAADGGGTGGGRGEGGGRLGGFPLRGGGRLCGGLRPCPRRSRAVAGVPVRPARASGGDAGRARRPPWLLRHRDA